MKKLALLALLSGVAVVAQAQTTLYSNTTTYTGSRFANGGATAAVPSTKLVADDIQLGSGFGGSTISGFTFTMSNLNTVAASANPFVRFYAGDGTGSAPGTLLGAINFGTVALNANSTTLLNYDPVQTTPLFTVPSNGLFWASLGFDNVGTTTTVDQLNLFGQRIYSPPTVGTSSDVFFLSTDPGTFTTSNPAGGLTYFGGTPAANFGWSFRGAAPVPEPATMAVLGLGAAALLRRRRKSA